MARLSPAVFSNMSIPFRFSRIGLTLGKGVGQERYFPPGANDQARRASVETVILKIENIPEAAGKARQFIDRGAEGDSASTYDILDRQNLIHGPS